MSDTELLYIIIGFCIFIALFCFILVIGGYAIYASYNPQISSILSQVKDFQNNYYPQLIADYTDFQTNYYPTVTETLSTISQDLPVFQNLLSQLQVIVPEVNNDIPQVEALLSQLPGIQANIATIASAAARLQSIGSWF